VPREKKRSFDELLPILEQAVPPTRALRPRLVGSTYRFTVWFPLLSKSGKEVFSETQVVDLAEFFANRFGGCSATAVEGRPPWHGIWVHKGKPVIDRHMLFVVYTAPVDDAKNAFRQLRTMLEEAGNQKIIVVEFLSVELLRGMPLSSAAN
jgi:hypothetical protein